MKQLLHLLIILIVTASCGHESGRGKIPNNGVNNDPTNNDLKQPTTPEPLPPSKNKTHINEMFSKDSIIPEKYLSCIFRVIASDGDSIRLASGFFISPDGVAISNYHVFEKTNERNESIFTNSSKTLKINEVIKKSKEQDYIIFEVDSTEQKKYFKISPTIPDINEKVYALGSTHLSNKPFSEGFVQGYDNDNGLIRTTTEIDYKGFGGPLVNGNGEVVGITVGLSEQGFNYAVNIRYLGIDEYVSSELKILKAKSEITAIVKKVINGDAFILETGEKIRLIGANAPEINHPIRGPEPHGQEAYDFIRNAIEGKKVKLEFDVELYDPSKHIWAYVFDGDTLVNEKILSKGLAKLANHPPNIKYQDRFLKAQKNAESLRIGIFSVN